MIRREYRKSEIRDSLAKQERIKNQAPDVYEFLKAIVPSEEPNQFLRSAHYNLFDPALHYYDFSAKLVSAVRNTMQPKLISEDESPIREVATREEIEATISTTIYTASQYGKVLTMFLKASGGRSLYGTVPKSIIESIPLGENVHKFLKDKHIRFSAEVLPHRPGSLRDRFVRPTNATLVE